MTETIRPRGTNMHEYHGVALADKANDSRELWVYSEELLPFIQKELKGVIQDNEIKTTSPSGEEYTSKLKTSNGILCIYKDDASNRTFPPDVRKGEQVTIFNLGDTDTWYWKSDGRNDNARRLERWRTSVSGTLLNNHPMDDDNTYFIEMETRERKRFVISTSKADGEKYRYIFEVDCDRSTVMLADDSGNQITIESEVPRLCMKNRDNSLIDLNQKDIIIACENDLGIRVGGNMAIKVNGNISEHIDKCKETKVKKDMETQVDKNMTTHVKENKRTDVDKNMTLTSQDKKSTMGLDDEGMHIHTRHYHVTTTEDIIHDAGTDNDIIAHDTLSFEYGSVSKIPL